jgi:hypothetical protein
MASKLQVLHTRNLRAQAVSLSPASDLCVVVSTEGLISLYRTITLEKVWSKDIADIFQSSSAPTCAAFDHSGRAVAVGFRNGDIGVIDVESIQGAKAFNRNEGTAASITALSWLKCLQHQRDTRDASCLWQPFAEPGSDSTTKSVEAQIGESESEYMLVASTADNHLLGLRFGLWPIFSVKTNSVFSCGDYGDGSFAGLYFTASGTGEKRHVTALTCLTPHSKDAVYPVWSHSRSLSLDCLNLHGDICAMQDMIGSAGKKWKEAVKPITAKIGLLQTAMDGYQLSSTPREMLYSVCLCGLWHPVVCTHFSQYWSEQALQRLRSSIESAADSVLWTLSMRAMPLANNLLLRCR